MSDRVRVHDRNLILRTINDFLIEVGIRQRLEPDRLGWHRRLPLDQYEFGLHQTETELGQSQTRLVLVRFEKALRARASIVPVRSVLFFNLELIPESPARWPEQFNVLVWTGPGVVPDDTSEWYYPGELRGPVGRPARTILDDPEPPGAA